MGHWIFKRSRFQPEARMEVELVKRLPERRVLHQENRAITQTC